MLSNFLSPVACTLSHLFYCSFNWNYFPFAVLYSTLVCLICDYIINSQFSIRVWYQFFSLTFLYLKEKFSSNFQMLNLKFNYYGWLNKCHYSTELSVIVMSKCLNITVHSIVFLLFSFVFQKKITLHILKIRCINLLFLWLSNRWLEGGLWIWNNWDLKTADFDESKR